MKIGVKSPVAIISPLRSFSSARGASTNPIMKVAGSTRRIETSISIRPGISPLTSDPSDNEEISTTAIMMGVKHSND